MTRNAILHQFNKKKTRKKKERERETGRCKIQIFNKYIEQKIEIVEKKRTILIKKKNNFIKMYEIVREKTAFLKKNCNSKMIENVEFFVGFVVAVNK